MTPVRNAVQAQVLPIRRLKFDWAGILLLPLPLIVFLVGRFDGTKILSQFTLTMRLQTSRTLCGQVLENGTDKKGCDICPWSTLHHSFRKQLTQFHDIHVAMFGDSRTRDIFHDLTDAIGGKQTKYYEQHGHRVNSYCYFKQHNVTVFYWCPYPDSCITRRMAKWSDPTGDRNIPHFIIIGLGAWTVMEPINGPGSFTSFGDDLRNVFGTFAGEERKKFIYLETLPLRSWLLRGNHTGRAPLLEKLRETGNVAAAWSNVTICRSARRTTKKYVHMFHDGFHFRGDYSER